MPDASKPKLTSPSAVKAWIEANRFSPSKVMGQNFLVDGNILSIMMEAGEVGAEDRILEVGPGLGILTQELAEIATHVVAIEKDRRLAEQLTLRLGDPDNLTLITADAVQEDLGRLQEKHHLNKFVANLPYSVGSRILVNAFMLDEGFDCVAVTVQLEVAERLAAACDSSDYGLLSIWAQLDYKVSIAKRVSPRCFYPRPTVTSAIVRLKRVHNRRASLKNSQVFDHLIKTAFSKRRKQIGTILKDYQHEGVTASPADALTAVHIKPSLRPEAIPVEAWIDLAEALQS